MSAVYTHSNVSFAVSANAYDSDLNLAGFQGVASWINVANVGSLPERGINTNMLSYDTVNTLVTKKAKGITDAGTGTLECARDENDAGQAKMTAIGQPNYFHSHAFKMFKQDGTVEYGRGLVSGPASPGGRNEDFDLSNYTIAFQQAPVSNNASGTTTYVVDVHSGVSGFQLVVGGIVTGIIDASATAINVQAAINAVLTGGVTATVTTGTDYNVVFSAPMTLAGIGATIS